MKYLKPRLYLLTFSIFYLLLIGLLLFYSIQVWKLKKKEVYAIASERIDQIEEDLALDAKLNKTDFLIYDTVLDLLNAKYTIEETKTKHSEYLSKVNLDITKQVEDVFKDLGYKVAFRLDLTDLILNETQESIIDKPITLLHTTNNVENLQRINTSEWEVENSSTNNKEENCSDCPEDYNVHFTVKQAKYIGVLNYKEIIFQELMPLFIGTFLICLCILILYYITFKTIQKKEREMVMLHNMVDNVSHEFKLPIATLKYACTILSKEKKSPTIQLVERQVDRLERLQNLLTKKTIETVGSFTEEDFNNVIDDLKTNYPSITIQAQWEVENTVNIPKTAMETILMNLIDNGAKYGGTTITCKIIHNKNKLYIIVEDNGIGIEHAEKSLIFNKFYRIMHNNIHTTKGLGLGLYQIKEIVEYYKGNVQIDSKLNKGSTFTITVPYV